MEHGVGKLRTLYFFMAWFILSYHGKIGTFFNLFKNLQVFQQNSNQMKYDCMVMRELRMWKFQEEQELRGA